MLDQEWLTNIFSIFEKQSLAFRMAITWVLTAALIWVDFSTPPTVVMTGFYFVPIILAAWFCGVKTLILITTIVSGISIEMRRELLAPTLDASSQILSYGSVAIAFLIVGGSMYLVNSIFLKMREENSTDHLTQIFNRRYLTTMLRGEFLRSKRTNRKFSMLMFDIDHFKRINDTYGHPIGDKVLMSISNEVARLIRDIDVFGRFGGEEFMVLLPETDLLQAIDAAERIRSAVEQLDMGGIKCTVSIGVESSEDTPTDTEMLEMVDIALYAAKAAGRNTVRCVRPSGSDCRVCSKEKICSHRGNKIIPTNCTTLRQAVVNKALNLQIV
jgi:diguanylate cyclase (GGDEF)-like protein